MEQQRAIEQLTWFFQSCERESGSRSPFGAQLAMAESGVEHDRSFPRSDDALARYVDRHREGGQVTTESSDVYQRLQRVGARHSHVLQLAFSDVMRIGRSDVSVSLACSTDLAQREYAKSCSKLKPGATRRTPREWIDWLSMPGKSSQSRAALLDAIIDEASTTRQLAITTYCNANGKTTKS